MMRADQFRDVVVEPLVASFADDIQSIAAAFAAVWAVDAYASYVAIEKLNGAEFARDYEGRFKDELERLPHPDVWCFRVVRAVSNAGKHAVRVTHKKGKVAYLLPDSSALRLDDFDGWAAYFADLETWGRQVVVDLDLIFEASANQWIDGKNNPFFGPFLSTVPVLQVLGPSLKLIDSVR